jgi:hypothetical protein
MADLTLDDYRRVLKWAGWKEGDSRHLMPLEDIWLWSGCRMWLKWLQLGDKQALLLLDYSVLERVRGMGLNARDNFRLNLESIAARRTDRPLDYRLHEHPGDAVKAALAANIIKESPDAT